MKQLIGAKLFGWRPLYLIYMPPPENKCSGYCRVVIVFFALTVVIPLSLKRNIRDLTWGSTISVIPILMSFPQCNEYCPMSGIFKLFFFSHLWGDPIKHFLLKVMSNFLVSMILYSPYPPFTLRVPIRTTSWSTWMKCRLFLLKFTYIKSEVY